LRLSKEALTAFPINVRLTNVGHSPAFNTYPFINVAESCEKLKQRPLDNPERGFDLFPEEQVTLEEKGFGGLGSVAFDPQQIGKMVSIQDEKEGIRIIFPVCIIYRSGPNFEPHKTGTIYRVGRKIRNKGEQVAVTYFLPLENKIIVKDDLFLEHLPSSSGMTD
jgi:hypothetical protein